jgi:hypothetical protein
MNVGSWGLFARHSSQEDELGDRGDHDRASSGGLPRAGHRHGARYKDTGVGGERPIENRIQFYSAAYAIVRAQAQAGRIKLAVQAGTAC